MLNPSVELFFVVRTGITFNTHINIHDLEDYVTVLVSEKYGAENEFGSFRYVKRLDRRIKFVEKYDYSANEQIINLTDHLINFKLPEISEINNPLF